MDKQYFETVLKNFINTAPGNFVQKEIALRPELGGMRIFDEPIFGYADAGDPYFRDLKKPGVIGDHVILPGTWLPEAKTVISIFLPLTEQVKAANRANMNWPADEWLHARIEGQAFQNEICRFGVTELEEAHFATVAPMINSRFFSRTTPAQEDKKDLSPFTSNWSERHAAYACGLGTFGLSKGLITRRGMAGRFISLITQAPFEPDTRPYTGIYEYCVRCGACVRNCPAQAISLEKGKSHPVCSAFLETTREKHRPRYGCGKCQVGVPCENRIPAGSVRAAVKGPDMAPGL
ncbi:MAG: 4Fe-4S binding protein [Treponema sp.]|jgi:epoxyqueuosine reductase QueG|nr:4Fe-4S binding protein [Treponema sp.]